MIPYPPRQLIDRIQHIPGWLEEEEGLDLYTAAATVDRSGLIVELGSYYGRSSVWLAKGAEAGKGARILCIDPWSEEGWKGAPASAGTHATRRDFLDTVQKFDAATKIQVHQGTSWDVAKSSRNIRDVSMLFIDGDHSLYSVLKDFIGWLPKMENNSIIALHDIGLESVAFALTILRSFEEYTPFVQLPNYERGIWKLHP